jgi:UDP-glucuronate decarboxylase
MKDNKQKTILVTGAAGFLGSHLSQTLLEKGCKVIGIDNLSSGSLLNLEAIRNSQEFKFIEHDITDRIDIECDEIYNLACPASPVQYQNNPIETLKTNVIGVCNLLELAVENRAKIFQASTSEVYGDPLEHPQKESYWGNVNPIGIRSCYDEGKRCAETLFFDYQREHKIEIKVARIFNTYGPKMQSEDGRVVSNFIVQALSGKPLTVYGEGMQTRSFCFVDDLIRGFVLLMDNEKLQGPVNLGNPSEFTMIELAKKIISLTSSNSEIIFKDLPQDDPKMRRPDIDLATQKLGWSPSISLDEGLKKTINYFMEIG